MFTDAPDVSNNQLSALRTHLIAYTTNIKLLACVHNVTKP